MSKTSSSIEPRGIRNNNPGNIRESGEHWQGLNGSDGTFAIFKEPKWGVRAMATILINYQRKHNLETIQDIIYRWAPPHENATDSYADTVASHVGVDVLAKVDVLNPQIMLPMVKSMIAVENGKQPYTDDQILEGLILAGVDVKKETKPLIESRTLHGAGMGMFGTVLGMLLEHQDIAISVASMLSPGIAAAAPKLLAVIGFAYAAYARVDDAKKGVK